MIKRKQSFYLKPFSHLIRFYSIIDILVELELNLSRISLQHLTGHTFEIDLYSMKLNLNEHFYLNVFFGNFEWSCIILNGLKFLKWWNIPRLYHAFLNNLNCHLLHSIDVSWSRINSWLTFSEFITEILIVWCNSLNKLQISDVFNAL